MPRDGTATRDRILDVAEEMIIDRGYAATAVDQVIARASSSKGAFFHHFDSKAALAQALVRRYVDADLAQLAAGLRATAHVTDPRRRAVALVQHFEDQGAAIMAAQSGCLYQPVLSEHGLADVPGTRDLVRDAVVGWRQDVGGVMRAALDAADAARVRAVDPEHLADHLFVTFEGAFLLCRGTGDPRLMEAQLRTFRHLLQALLGLAD